MSDESFIVLFTLILLPSPELWRDSGNPNNGTAQKTV